MKLASFDIFDTTLIRRCGKPENIFYILASRLFPDDRALREEFLLWRRNAESNAHRHFPGTDVSLAQIYSDQEGLTGFAPYYSPARMMEMEVQVETDNLVTNPAIKSLIGQKRNEGYDICFISDMYLDSCSLRKILSREGCICGDEKIYVSCEHNARKSDGKLFDVVRKNMSPDEWEHWGDNKASDVRIPRKKGITSHRVNTAFSETEARTLNQSACADAGYELSILVGLQRAAKICLGNDPFACIASDYIVPSYVPYVYFLMQEARQRGLKRLYFLSRDSYVLMKMAEMLKDAYPDIELRYLFVSRKSLIMPYLTEATAEQYLAAQDHRTIYGKSVDSLLKSLGTGTEELQAKYDISFDYSRITNKRQETDFLEKVFGVDSPFLPELKRRIAERYDLLKAYFSQEGLLDGTPSGMVDVGWLGTSRLMINSILKNEGADATEFFYFGIRGDVLPSKYGVYSSFYRPHQLSTELTTLVENYFSASPYPSTVGYMRSEDGSIMPVYAKGQAFRQTPITESNVNVSIWVVKEMNQMALDFRTVFGTWAKTAIDAISHMSVRIDLKPFVAAADFDDTAFVRKLTFVEMFRLTFLGEHITAFDRASLRLSAGRYLDSLLWKLHNVSGKIRRYLYLRLKK